MNSNDARKNPCCFEDYSDDNIEKISDVIESMMRGAGHIQENSRSIAKENFRTYTESEKMATENSIQRLLDSRKLFEICKGIILYIKHQSVISDSEFYDWFQERQNNIKDCVTAEIVRELGSHNYLGADRVFSVYKPMLDESWYEQNRAKFMQNQEETIEREEEKPSKLIETTAPESQRESQFFIHLQNDNSQPHIPKTNQVQTSYPVNVPADSINVQERLQDFQSANEEKQSPADSIYRDPNKITKEYLYIIVMDDDRDRLKADWVDVNIDENTILQLKESASTFREGVQQDYNSAAEMLYEDIGEYAAQYSSELSLEHSWTIQNGKRLSLKEKKRSEERVNEIREKWLNHYKEQRAHRFRFYINHIESIAPRISRLHDYCTGLSAAYAEAELDYSSTPDNEKIVNNITEYYHALILEGLYIWAEGNNEVKGYSHRKRGWTAIDFEMDNLSEIKLQLSTNFGYGRSSYFHEILSYKGIKILNPMPIIFYYGINAQEYANATNWYDSVEKSYKYCFDDCINKYNEFKEIGAQSFIAKHVKESIDKLAGLMGSVAHKHTFFQVCDLGLLNDLLNMNQEKLLFDPDIGDGDHRLESRTEDAISEYVDKLKFPYGSQGAPRADEACARKLKKKLSINWDYLDKQAYAQMIRIGVMRHRLKEEVLAKHPTTPIYYVNRLVDEVSPKFKDYFVTTFEGYELIHFRIEKAIASLSMLPSIQELSKMVNVKLSITSIISACEKILGQATQYRDLEIVPAIERVNSALSDAKSDLERFMTHHKLYMENGTSKGIESYPEHKQNEIETRLEEINTDIMLFEKEKTNLEKQIKVIDNYTAKMVAFKKA